MYTRRKELQIRQLNIIGYCKLSNSDDKEFIVVEFDHLNLSLSIYQLGTGAHIFLNLYQNLTGVILSLIGDGDASIDITITYNHHLNNFEICCLNLSEIIRVQYVCIYKMSVYTRIRVF
jgi:hypothetical protein